MSIKTKFKRVMDNDTRLHEEYYDSKALGYFTMLAINSLSASDVQILIDENPDLPMNKFLSLFHDMASVKAFSDKYWHYEDEMGKWLLSIKSDDSFSPLRIVMDAIEDGKIEHTKHTKFYFKTILDDKMHLFREKLLYLWKTEQLKI